MGWNSTAVASSGCGAVGALRGFHFTFIPLAGSFSTPSSSHANERPRPLPEFESFREGADGEDGGPVVERCRVGPNPTITRSKGKGKSHHVQPQPKVLLANKAGVLRPPANVPVPDFVESELKRDEELKSPSTPPQQMGALAWGRL